MARTQRLLAYLTVACATILLAGLVGFAHIVSDQAPTGSERAEAIVVLTGGEHRIQAGLRLLADGRGKRLLISGVNRANSRALVLKRFDTPGDTLLTCCIDIGYSAHDTVGNAEETFEWAANHRYKSLLVVTSNYHMPRGLVELSRVLPGVNLVAYPVISPNARLQKWWQHPGTARLILTEYLKLLPAMARLAISRLSGGAADVKLPDLQAKRNGQAKL